MDVMASLDRKLGIGKSSSNTSPYPPQMSKYERIRAVGKGSFGQAVLVKNKVDGLHYIVKEINIGQMSEKEKRDSMNEIAVLAKLHHPNIVRYHEHYLYSNMLYIIMEYADGGDLWSLIQTRAQKHQRLSEEEVLNYFIQICLALKNMHDQKMLHRDLKTGNIFLTQKGVVKLGDFGISTALRHTAAFANTVCGTPNYFSPEMCQNKPYNNKSDIWALGCILYEMLSGHVAFQGNNMQDLYQKIMKASLTPLQQGLYSQELRHLCGRLLAQSHAMRPDINAVLRSYVLQKHLQTLQTNFKQQQEQLQLQQNESKTTNTNSTSSHSNNIPTPAKQTQEEERERQKKEEAERAKREAEEQAREKERARQEAEERRKQQQREEAEDEAKKQREQEDFERELDALLDGKTLTEEDIMACMKGGSSSDDSKQDLPKQPDNSSLRGRAMEDFNNIMSQLDTVRGDDKGGEESDTFFESTKEGSSGGNNYVSNQEAPAPAYGNSGAAPFGTNDSLSASMRRILDEELDGM
eukprot:TRINITY_DN84641_c0_g1_i1.p1 TRINITY_DN84641_c0_g1~~TRINITY_DN84641_c0_g1_i1.p1  ORF type:complete len:523 (-),score=65.80 TRINITY_DN84641_c0_g1_i1:1150-2718(-)